MPSTPQTQSSIKSITTTVLLISLLLLGCFPNLFHLLLILPLRLLTPSTYFPKPLPPPIETNPSFPATMSWFQKTFTLPTKSRGSYLITDEVLKNLPELKGYKVGVLHLFIQHTSCALSLNENWDSDVRADMSDALDRIAPEDKGGELYRHSAEGLDDSMCFYFLCRMRKIANSQIVPAHIKSALIGASVSIPITNGKLATGTWQGIWYLEFRASKHQRKVVATINGEKA